MARKKNSKARRSPAPSSEVTQAAAHSALTFTLPYRPQNSAPPVQPPEPKPSKAKRRKQNLKRDIVQEFARYFGEETKLENWQRLCRDVGIQGNLPSLTKCRIELKRVWVNIHDLLDAVAANDCPPENFPSRAALSKYTIEKRRVFPKEGAKEGGPVRCLLAHIFR